MLVEPDDLTASQVLEVVALHWDAGARSCGFVPRGAGAQHWVVGGRHRPRWFVTADDVSAPGREDELEDTYVAARDLAETVAQVVATVPPRDDVDSASRGLTPSVAGVNSLDAESTVPARAGVRHGRYLLTVTPFLDGESGPMDYADDDQRALVARALGALHAAIPPPGLRAWQPGPPLRAELVELLGRLDEPWTAGPHGESIRMALRDNAAQLTDLLRRFDVLAALATDRRDRWVPTHGEPHTGNVLWTAGGPRLVDWESLRLAPRERDLRWVLRDAEGAEPLSAYLATAGADLESIDLDDDLVELFDLEWWLWETGSYAVRFHDPHPGDADDERFLRAFLDEVVPTIVQGPGS